MNITLKDNDETAYVYIYRCECIANGHIINIKSIIRYIVDCIYIYMCNYKTAQGCTQTQITRLHKAVHKPKLQGCTRVCKLHIPGPRNFTIKQWVRLFAQDSIARKVSAQIACEDEKPQPQSKSPDVLHPRPFVRCCSCI